MPEDTLKDHDSDTKWLFYIFYFGMAIVIFIALQFILPGRSCHLRNCKICGAYRYRYSWPLFPSYESKVSPRPLTKWMEEHNIQHKHSWSYGSGFGVRGFVGMHREEADGGPPIAYASPYMLEDYLENSSEEEILQLLYLLNSNKLKDIEKAEMLIHSMNLLWYENRDAFIPKDKSE